MTVTPATTATDSRASQCDNARLRAACESFEALLVSHLLKDLWQTTEALQGDESSSPGSAANSAYRDMFSFEVAKGVAGSAKLGIAETLYRGMTPTSGREVGQVGNSPQSSTERGDLP